VRCVQKKRRGGYTMRSSGDKRTQACSNTPERTFSRHRSSRYRQIRTRSLTDLYRGSKSGIRHSRLSLSLGTGRNVWARPLPIEDVYYPNGFPRKEFDTEIRHYLQFDRDRGKEALRNIYSPTHQIDVKMKGETTARVSFETKNNTPTFQLFYGLFEQRLACRS